MRQRDLRAQRLARQAERWQQERDDDLEETDVPDQDDEPPRWETLQ